MKITNVVRKFNKIRNNPALGIMLDSTPVTNGSFEKDNTFVVGYILTFSIKLILWAGYLSIHADRKVPKKYKR